MSVLEPPLGVVALNRLGFGPRPGELAAFNELGDNDDARLKAWLDGQLDPGSLDDSDAERRIAASGFVSLDADRRTSWETFVRGGGGEGVNADQPLQELRRLAMLRATYSRRQLLEVLVDFWHNHFNVFGNRGILYSMIVRYDRDVIREHALGNFRAMLGAVAESTCMLVYLDNYLSTDAGPNENWARELLELHTLGAEHYLGAGLLQSEVETNGEQPVGYVDDDVYEATRAFTGWTIANSDDSDTGEFLYVRDNHDRFQKQVVGRFLPADQPDLADGNQVLDTLAGHPGTAVHVSRKLCRRLVSDDPPEDLVQSAADVFSSTIDADDQIAQVVRHIVEAPEFRAGFGQKVKRPFEYTAGFLRQTGVELDFAASAELPEPEEGAEADPVRQARQYTERLLRLYDDLGQPLFGWPAPDGYSDQASYWLNTNSVFKRWRLVNEAVAASENDAWIIDLETMVPDEVQSSHDYVDFWADRILGFELASATSEALVDFLAQGFDPTFALPIGDDETDERKRALVALVFMTPEYLWR